MLFLGRGAGGPGRVLSLGSHGRSGFSSPRGCLEATEGETGRAAPAHLPLLSTPHPGACSPESGIPTHRRGHPRLQGRGSVPSPPPLLRSTNLPSVVSSAASPSPSSIYFIHPSTYSALPYVQRQHSKTRSIPEDRGHREHTRGIGEQLLCTDTARGPGNTAVDETGVSLTSQQGSTRGVRRGSASWRKDRVGRGSGVPAQRVRGRPEEPEQAPAWNRGGWSRRHCSEPWAPLSLDTQNRGVCLGMNTKGGKTSALDERED